MRFRFPAQAGALTPVADYLYWAVIGGRDALGPDSRDGAALLRAWARCWNRRRWTERHVQPGRRRVGLHAAGAQRAGTAPWPASRVTLLGDAIHAMSPAGGVGANTALDDAARLARHLARAARDGDLPAALAAYETDMRPRQRRRRGLVAGARGAGARLMPHRQDRTLVRSQLQLVRLALRWTTSTARRSEHAMRELAVRQRQEQGHHHAQVYGQQQRHGAGVARPAKASPVALVSSSSAMKPRSMGFCAASPCSGWRFRFSHNRPAGPQQPDAAHGAQQHRRAPERIRRGLSQKIVIQRRHAGGGETRMKP